jgi:hypothetical protein
VVATSLDAEWTARGSEVVSTSAPTSMTSAAYGSTNALIAWSTADQCHIRSVSATDSVVLPHACQNARLAVDFALRGGWMVYERGESIRLARVAANDPRVMTNDRELAPIGKAPRIAYDGATFWVSYIGAHGDVVVGLVDSAGNVEAAAATGTAPAADAYDLTIGQASAAIYAADASGLGATWFCKSYEP